MNSRLLKVVPLLTICPTWPLIKTANALYVPSSPSEDNIFTDPSGTMFIGVKADGTTYVIGGTSSELKSFAHFESSPAIDMTNTEWLSYSVLLPMFQNVYDLLSSLGAKSVLLQVSYSQHMAANAATANYHLKTRQGFIDGVAVSKAIIERDVPTIDGTVTIIDTPAFVMSMASRPADAFDWSIETTSVSTQVISTFVTLTVLGYQT